MKVVAICTVHRLSGALANRAGINIIGVIRRQYSNWYRRTANSMW